MQARGSGNKRRLLPQPQAINNPSQLIVELDKVSPGIGSNWSTYRRISTDCKLTLLRLVRTTSIGLRKTPNEP